MEENYDLKKIATAQRGVLMCVLVYILCIASNFIGLGGIAIYVMIPLVLVAMFFVFKLAQALNYSMVVAILCCILLVVPLVSLITMLVLNGKATKILKENGIKVGLFGANVND